MGQQLFLDFDQELDESLTEDIINPFSVGSKTQSLSSGNEGRGVAASVRDERIEDVGEVIFGARKDMLRDVARMSETLTEQTLIEKPLSKVFKKLDLKKAFEQGILREKDARFYEAFYYAMLDTRKPKLKESDARHKKWNPDYETPVEVWARKFSEAARMLNSFVLSSENDRDRAMDLLMSEHFTGEEGYARPVPNPVWFLYEALDKMGYYAGDNITVPFPLAVPRGNSDYILTNNNGEYARLPYASSLEECMDNMIYLTRLKSGQTDLEHPLDRFRFPSTRSIYGETGNYEVFWGTMRNHHTMKFSSKEEADVFAAQKNAKGIFAYVMPERNVVGHTDYVISFYHPLTGERMKLGDKVFETEQEASAYLKENYPELNDLVNQRIAKDLEKRGERKPLRPEDVVRISSVFQGYGKDWKYAVQIDKKYANNYGEPYSIKEFYNRKEAVDFLEANKESIFKIVIDYLESHKKMVFYDTGEYSRFGEDYRHGNDVGAEDFMVEFGFRGVQFGNWTNQEDRQLAVNQAYDAFHDLARLLDVSPRAISLNGELGIAFGSRGTGWANAHYESYEVVINLTKTRGAGSLAHEWWHALDNYFARQDGNKQDFVTEKTAIPMRQPLRQAFNDMLSEVRDTDFYKRSNGMRNAKYWGSPVEVTARLFAEWVDQELKARGELNTFLSRGTNMEYAMETNYIRYQLLSKIAGKEPMDRESFKDESEALAGFPYPSTKEVAELGKSVRAIFDQVLEREDMDTGRVALYHRVGEMLNDSVAPLVAAVNEEERELRDCIVERMKEAGLEVSTDWKEGQQVLDADHERLALLMGSNVNNRMVEIAEALKDINMTNEQRAVIDVFIGKKNKSQLTLTDVKGHLRSFVIRQGNENGAGTKHSLFGHYGTTINGYESKELLLVPEIISKGQRQQDSSNKVSYKYKLDDVIYTVTTINKGKREFFTNFYTNRKPTVAEQGTQNTVEQRVQPQQSVTSANIAQKNENPKGNVENIKLYKVFHENNVKFDTFDHQYIDIVRGRNIDSYNNYSISSEKVLELRDQARFFRTSNGDAYGFTLGGKVYIDPKIATSETPIHEYSHLWAAALRSGNPVEWKNVVSLMKECKPLWEKVKTNYPELKTDDEIADEVLAHYSGSRGAERLRKEQKVVMDSANDETHREGIASMFDKVRDALGKFWDAVSDMLHIHYSSANQVADRVLYDLLRRSVLEEHIRPLNNSQDDPESKIQFSQTIKDDSRIDGVSAESIQYVEQRLGDVKITARNYSEKIARINDLFRFYQSGVKETLPYREVFPTPTLDDYYIDTEVVFKSIGSSLTRESIADNKLAFPPSLNKANRDNWNLWKKMKESGQFEFHESPNYLSGSQYLIDRQSGDIYRYSGHWGKVASCNWDIDADEIQFLFLIGKANIKDFRSHASFKYQAENPDWKAGYAAALAKTVENYKALLNSRIQMTSVVRKQVTDKLQMYEGLVDSLNDSGHIEDRYNLRMSKVGMSLPVTDDKREMNKDNDKSPTTEKSDNPLNDTITMEQQEQKNEQQQVQKQSGVERHAEILIAGLERAMQKDGLFVNEQQKARPMIYGKDYRLGGVNSLVMALRSDEAGYKTNAYLLFNDVQKRGEAVRKGQTNTPIIWVNRNEYVSKENPEDRIDARQFKELGSAEQAKYRLNPREDAIAAFNIDQTTMRSAHKTEYENFVSAYAGFEKQDSYLSETDMALRKEVNDFLKQMKANLVPIHNDKQKTGVVSYDENRDVIVLPSQKNFESYNDYVQAAVGHVVMATSIPGRLNRDNRDEQRESLVQDLTTAVKMLDFGLPAKLRPETMESLPQLIGKMKDDPRFAEGIIRDVNRTYSMITKAELGSRIEVRPVPSVESSPDKYHAVTMVKDDENKWTLVMKPEEGPVLAVHPFGKDTARYFDEVKSGSKDSVEEMRTELARKYYALATEKKIPTVNLFESKASQEELALISKVNMIKVQDGKMLLVAHVDGEKQKPAVITQEQWNRLWLAGDKQSYKTHLAATLYADVIAAKLAACVQTAKVQAEDQAKRANEKQTQQVEQAKKQEEEKRRNSPEQKEKERREEQAKKELTKAETKAVAAVALAPMFQQFLDIKGRNSDRILLMHVDDRYETYQDDARKVSKLAQLPLQKSASAKDAEGKPVVFVSFPEQKLDTYLPMLVRHNESVALADDLTRPKAEKEQPEVMRQNPVEKNVDQPLTEQRGGGMRR